MGNDTDAAGSGPRTAPAESAAGVRHASRGPRPVVAGNLKLPGKHLGIMALWVTFNSLITLTFVVAVLTQVSELNDTVVLGTVGLAVLALMGPLVLLTICCRMIFGANDG